MSLLKIRLTPAESYFLGGERCVIFDEENATQRSLDKPYFLRSGHAPAQTTLFGVTRFLGIRNPRSDMVLTPEDKKAIGENSFNLTEDDRAFGVLLGISPLILTYQDNGSERHFIPAPMHHLPSDDARVFQPYRCYQTAQTLDGLRWLPEEYDAKIYESRKYICLETGVLEDPFSSHVQVGINLQEDRSKPEPSGFFKREMVRLRPGYSFTWFARLKDGVSGFTDAGSRTVFIGQGGSAFSARWETVDEDELRSRLPGFLLPVGEDKEAVGNPGRLPECFPPFIAIRSKWGQAGVRCFYAYVASDLFFSQDSAVLRQACRFALTQIRDQRSFTTVYGAGKKMSNRYKKNTKELRKMIVAGSVFLFESGEQLQAFKECLENSKHFKNGTIAGLNRVYYSDTGGEPS